MRHIDFCSYLAAAFDGYTGLDVRVQAAIARDFLQLYLDEFDSLAEAITEYRRRIGVGNIASYGACMIAHFAAV